MLVTFMPQQSPGRCQQTMRRGERVPLGSEKWRFKEKADRHYEEREFVYAAFGEEVLARYLGREGGPHTVKNAVIGYASFWHLVDPEHLGCLQQTQDACLDFINRVRL